MYQALLYTLSISHLILSTGDSQVVIIPTLTVRNVSHNWYVLSAQLD